MGTAKRIKDICCIGAGYVGGPTCAVIASRNPDINVTVVDINQARIDAWNSSSLPIYEPSLQDVVEEARDGSHVRRPNLIFNTDMKAAIAKAELIFISTQTPPKKTGIGAGRASDIKFVEAAAREIAKVATSDKIVVEKSTVPCGTAAAIQAILRIVGRPGVRFDILSNPEFLSEGTAVADLLNPGRIRIGSEATPEGLSAAESLAAVYASWVAWDRIILTNTWSSEMAKLAANCMLAQRISSINSLSAICEATGADIDEVAKAVGMDDRIGSRFLKSGVGFGGSCFHKDVLNLVYMAETLSLPEVARYWSNVVEINEWQKRRFSRRIVQALNNTVDGKRVAILGLAYKANTGDTRESPAWDIIEQLLNEGARLMLFDPKVDYLQFKTELAVRHGQKKVDELVVCCEDGYTACDSASAILILTEWDQFKTAHMEAVPSLALERTSIETEKVAPLFLRTRLSESSSSSSLSRRSSFGDSGCPSPATPPTRLDSPGLKAIERSNPARLDWRRIAELVRRPMLLFDGRHVVEANKLEPLGFVVHQIGKADRSVWPR